MKHKCIPNTVQLPVNKLYCKPGEEVAGDMGVLKIWAHKNVLISS